MLCLGIDTALGACSVALASESGLRARRYRAMTAGHAEALAPMAEALMAEAGVAFADLGRIAVTTGPGTFTGQRIGLAFARGLAAALGIGCVGLTTLEVIAAAARAEFPGRPVLVASDARRGEAYVQGFAADGAPLGPPALLTLAGAAQSLAALGGAPVLAGTAAAAIAALLAPGAAALARSDQPDAAIVARLGLALPEPSGPPAPLYLRAPDAKLPGPLKAPPPQYRARP